MDNDRFDDLTRALAAVRSRRGALASLGAGIAAAISPGLDADDAGARRRRRKRRRRKKKVIVCVPNCALQECGPNGCGGSCGTCGSRRTCVSGTCVCSVTDCGNGLCCPARSPQCCPPTTQDPEGSCTQTGRTCCTSEQGGGACPVERPKCCEATPENRRGLCLLTSEVCCTAQQGGGWCPGTLPQCCPPTTRFPRGTCCAEGRTCCNDDTNCAADQICDAGCCRVPETPRERPESFARGAAEAREKPEW
jgi:hypothetical protein